MTKANARKSPAKAVNFPAAKRNSPICEKVAELMGLMFGEFAKEAGLALRDEVSAFRTQRLISFWDKFAPQLQKREIPPSQLRKLPFGLGIRILENVSEEDNDDVLDLWAKLVASALDPNAAEIEKAFVSILSQIGGTEVLVLRLLWLRLKCNDVHICSIRTSEVKEFADRHLKTKGPRSRAVAIMNLVRVGCVRLQLDDYYLDNIEFNDREFVLSADDNGKDSLREIKRSLDAVRRLIEDIAGARHVTYLGLSDAIENAQGRIPEVAFELTELGVELMSRCDPPIKSAA